jgi:FtsZ-interacting cell division protein ZipA
MKIIIQLMTITIVITFISLIMILGVGLWAGQSWFFSGQCKIFLFSTASKTDSGDHPASYAMGTGGSFPRSKAAGA